MFLSQGAPQNILGRHGNPWRAASPWQASTLTFQQATQHWDGFLGHLKGNGSWGGQHDCCSPLAGAGAAPLFSFSSVGKFVTFLPYAGQASYSRAG